MRCQRKDNSFAYNATNLTVIKRKRRKNSILLYNKKYKEIKAVKRVLCQRTYLRNCRQQTKRMSVDEERESERYRCVSNCQLVWESEVS